MLSISELKGYLGTGLKCHVMGEWVEGTEDNDTPTPIVATLGGLKTERVEWVDLDTDQSSYYFVIDDVFPILHPLSDLTKPCLEGGKVPIIELLKLKHPYNDYNSKYGEISIGDGFPSACYSYRANFSIMLNTNDVKNWHNWIVEKLYEWHFWIGDQSRFKEDIVDINTLP